MVVNFVVGMTSDKKLNDDILKESQQYGDILRGEFMDAYRNMTLKALLVLKYTIEHCKQVPFLVKSDDDMLINIPYLVRVLRTQSPLKRSIIGNKNVFMPVLREGKWEISVQDFPFEYFAPYVSGAAYVMTTDILEELYVTSKHVPWIFIDDAHITGTLARICNVTVLDICEVAKLTTLFGSPSFCDVILQRTVFKTDAFPERLTDIWNKLRTYTETDLEKCKNETNMH